MREIDDIHVPFKAWLDERRIPYVYHRPDRKSGIQEGHPDFTILWTRRQIMIECKATGGKLSPKQLERIDFLRRSGNVVEIARSLSECVDAAYKVLCEGKPATEAYGACNYPLGGCFEELKRAVSEVPGNGTKDLSGSAACAVATDVCPTSTVKAMPKVDSGTCKPPAQNFYIGDWKGTQYVFGPDLDGNYKMIRKASVIDIDNLPKLP
jgi:hypothetical protein